ncbi:MAG: ActS/PrrB/RegB family redox-sensitive histidine kinase, partial [Hyphomicrobiaceae bacterium]|nr:ActS/PrrB/RegB family redox-sensitive histidine kinase [Hyphomicrobiaceae bacterium]
MTKQPMAAALSQSPPLRLTTFVRIRWLAVAGQSAALLFVDSVLGFPFPLLTCAVLVILSAALNLYLTLRYPVAQRMSPRAVFDVLLFDIMQLGGLLYLTGGAQNPFLLLLIVPVVISATVLTVTMTISLGVLAIAIATLLVFFHMPLPWYPDTHLVLPFVYVGGQWVAIVSSLMFTGVYAWRVAAEARQLSDALTATELILQREQHLSAIDGLAAAAAHELGTPLATIALVAKEMSKALEGDERFADDLALLNSQAARCRDILKRISSLDADNRDYFDRLPLSSLVEEVVAPHRDFDVDIETRIDRQDKEEPVTRRNSGVLYGLGNIVE